MSGTEDERLTGSLADGIAVAVMPSTPAIGQAPFVRRDSLFKFDNLEAGFPFGRAWVQGPLQVRVSRFHENFLSTHERLAIE